MTLFEIYKFKNRAALGTMIEDKKGRKYRCVGSGNDRNGVRVWLFRQFNTDETPIEFEVDIYQFNEAVEQKRIFYINQ